MTAPWMDRLPTPEEVEAHAAAHGVEYGCAGRIGLWMLREEHEPVPLCGELQLGRGGAEGWDYLWNPHIGEHEDGDTVKLGPGDRLCPLTADGMPVALVTELAALRAERNALRAALAVQAAAVRQHDAAQATLRAAEARDAATLRRREATPGDTLAELAAAREEAQRWNARATELETERDALRTRAEGRTTPPTPAEIAAHPGPWLVQYSDGGYDVLTERAALRYVSTLVGPPLRPVRWWPLEEVPRG